MRSPPGKLPVFSHLLARKLYFLHSPLGFPYNRNGWRFTRSECNKTVNYEYSNGAPKYKRIDEINFWVAKASGKEKNALSNRENGSSRFSKNPIATRIHEFRPDYLCDFPRNNEMNKLSIYWPELPSDSEVLILYVDWREVNPSRKSRKYKQKV